jgi:hypothetical protein
MDLLTPAMSLVISLGVGLLLYLYCREALVGDEVQETTTIRSAESDRAQPKSVTVHR